MSRATFTFGRFNPPTETGHGKLVSAVQSHAEETGASHYIFPSHTQDAKKNPLSHEHKVGAMQKMFKGANVVSHSGVRTAIDAMKHLESKGHTHVTMVVGSDRVKEFHGLLNKYRKKEYPGIKKVSVVSAGHRDPDAEGAEGMSASKLRELVKAGKKKEFMSHYSDKKLAAHIHDKVKSGMQTESTNPVGIFLIGSPGSGKDYVLNNIFSRFDLTEVQVEHILNGAAKDLYAQGKNIVINGALDEEKIEEVKIILEGYDFDHVYVAVSNKVSRLRNALRSNPLSENKRIEKWYRAEKLAEHYNCFKFNNSINLNESSDFEKVFFASEIQKLLERVVGLGLNLKEIAEPKQFVREEKEVWDKPYEKKSKPLSSLQKAKAKARAGRAGRKYPNLVDNMWAANEDVENNNLDSLFERQLVGTDEYRRHAISMTPGQDQEINKPFEPKKIISFKKKVEEDKVIDATPTLKKGNRVTGALKAQAYNAKATSDGLPVVSRLTSEAKKKPPMFMPNAPQLPPPPGGHPVPAGYERVKDSAGFNVLRKIREKPATVKEAVEYHLENKISFTENVFRPGSDMFFEMISEAKRLYKEGNYTPKDEWEADMLETEIGEKAIYEGQEVILDFPFEEELNEEDKTDGKGIGKPWREGGGGAVYVRDGESIRKIRFSQSGMKKKFNDPAATRSFVARHRCLTNKDKTTSSYWACRYPRFFSNSGKIWW